MARDLLKYLRSRRLAVWLIVAVVAYAALATIAVDGEWATPYRHPAFLSVVALLALSTTSCAWERTRAAFRESGKRDPAAGSLARLVERPDLKVAVADSNGLEVAERSLRSLRMRTVREGDVIEARSGIAGVIGSAVFHWALAALLVVVAAGQLSRSEGLMGVVAGSAKPDLAGSYGRLDRGPLGELTGRVIAVPVMDADFTARGVAQGMTPFVEIRSPDASRVLASGYAYANHPVRYRSMLVHASAYGLAAVFDVSGPEGRASKEILLDYDETGTSVVPAGFSVTDSAGTTLATVMVQPAEPGGNGEARVQVMVSDPGGVPRQSVAAVGDEVPLVAGLRLTVVDLTTYARLSVVRDWSVPIIYALFAVGVVGLVLALFVPRRVVRVLAIECDGSTVLHAVVRQTRGEPGFPARVEAALGAPATEEGVPE